MEIGVWHSEKELGSECEFGNYICRSESWDLGGYRDKGKERKKKVVLSGIHMMRVWKQRETSKKTNSKNEECSFSKGKREEI